MTYLENMNITIKSNNNKACLYGDGKAWDNKKAKTLKTHFPRGKVLHRFYAILWKENYNKLVDLNKKLEGLLQ